jgi:hypothetical protein
LCGSTTLNIHAASSSRADPPGSPAFPEDNPTYQENNRLLCEWESKNEDYVTPSSQQLVTEPNSQPSLENWNDVMSCDVPGLMMPGTLEERMLRPRSSPPRFGEISNIPHILSDEGSTPSDPHGGSPTTSPYATSPQESSVRISDQVENDFAGAPSLSEESRLSVPPPVLDHAPTSNAHTPVVRTSGFGMTIEEMANYEI